MKQLVFHDDLVTVVVYVGGRPVTLQGEVDVVLREPTKKSKANKNAWASVTTDSASAISLAVDKDV